MRSCGACDVGSIPTGGTKFMRTPLSEKKLQELIEKIEPFKVGFDAIGEHVIITDENANILYANKGVEEQTGFSIQEIIGKTPADVWGGKMPKDFYKTLWHTIKTEKKPFVGELNNVKKDGTKYWQEIHIHPIFNHDGTIKFFIAIEPNITERKEKEKFKEEFISIISHQLKNPLTVMKWTLEILAKIEGATSSDQKRIKVVLENTQSIIDLVNDLTIISKIGKIDTQTNIDLFTVINSIIEQAKVANRNTVIEFKKDMEPCIIKSNSTLSFEVFKNLIFNAAEYSDKDHGIVNIHLKKENDYYLFSVENNGIEIPKNEQSKIFSKFFRASNASDRKESGTGLGLFIAKMICDYFGWQISFKSPTDKGNGAIFHLKIPI